MNKQETTSIRDSLPREDKNVSPDIIRLLDLLARIEIRRRNRLLLAAKEKAS